MSSLEGPTLKNKKQKTLTLIPNSKKVGYLSKMSVLKQKWAKNYFHVGRCGQG